MHAIQIKKNEIDFCMKLDLEMYYEMLKLQVKINCLPFF